MKLFKTILGLMINKASKQQYYLEIGAHLLRKGAAHKIGDVVKGKKLGDGRWRVKVITGMFFDFGQNRINHTSKNDVIRG